MTTTYSYAGEFSSDDDFESNLAIVKKNSWAKVAEEKLQSLIDEAVSMLKALPSETDYEITDEVLAGALDRYKAQRGPIVDSTRQLYKRILHHAVREEQASKIASHESEAAINKNKQQQSGSNDNTIVNNNNDNSSNKSTNDSLASLWYKEKQRESRLTVNDFIDSSDDDEPVPLMTASHRHNSNGEPMDVDPIHQNTLDKSQIRTTKVVESSSSCSSDGEDSDDEDTDETEDDQDEVQLLDERQTGRYNAKKQPQQHDNITLKDQLQQSKLETSQKSEKLSTEIVDTPTHVSEMSSSTPISRNSRIRKLAGPAHGKEDAFEKQTPKAESVKRRPTTRSQQKSSQSISDQSVDGVKEQEESSLKVGQQDQSGSRITTRSFWIRLFARIIMICLICYLIYHVFSSKYRRRSHSSRFNIDF